MLTFPLIQVRAEGARLSIIAGPDASGWPRDLHGPHTHAEVALFGADGGRALPSALGLDPALDAPFDPRDRIAQGMPLDHAEQLEDRFRRHHRLPELGADRALAGEVFGDDPLEPLLWATRRDVAFAARVLGRNEAKVRDECAERQAKLRLWFHAHPARERGFRPTSLAETALVRALRARR